MPRTVALPTVALQNMTAQALAAVAENAPHVSPPPTPYTPPSGAFIGTAGYDEFHGTDNADVFVFDLQATGQQDVIYGFDTTEDILVFINAPVGDAGVTFSPGSNTFSYSYDNLSTLALVGPVTTPEDYILELSVYDLNGYGWASSLGLT